ncbi:hypothetical protein HYN59_11285 [Flavobacterium album]|uniref:Secretion system C-terminal sorting domain-containing protein n=1 Tax=Flavobacterium album TaxID=2175091 RepID=A0A2S1QZ09_9FLAO|nr:ELWxxDGT repeat protein [Flavobacterium album]AWH85653.1 hypothetical protein HYN59_11285 [Flavobacterium album]
MKQLLFSLLTILSLSKLTAQSINAELLELNFAGDSNPKDITKGTTKIFFSATEDIHGRELWIHDLITGETSMVKDINPGYEPSIDNYPYFTVIGDILYFVTTPNMANGGALWRSDGTAEGTYMIKNFAPESVNDQVRELVALNGTIYFIGYDNINGKELWKSDGTESGTIMIKDIYEGAGGSDISNIFSCNNAIYFTARDTTHGYEMWKSDGTPEGTFMLRDIYTGSGSSTFGKSIVLGNDFYFIAFNNIVGSEMWKSNGTTEGTQLFKEFVPGTNGVSSNFDGIAINDYFVFMITYQSGSTQLWKSDGTLVGTSLLRQINQAQDGFTTFSQFVMFDNVAYFTAGDSFYGYKQLWKTDGTVAGTQLVRNLSSNIYELSATENFLIFASSATSTFPAPWVSDGTPTGTNQLNNLDLTGDSSGELRFIPVGNTIYFPASKGVSGGMELWKTDGTIVNTVLVKDIFHKYSGLTGGAAKTAYPMNDKMVFLGSDGEYGLQPFITDATLSGTHIVMQQNPQNGPIAFWDEYSWPEKAFTKAGNKLFYKGRKSETGYEIFCTDGTEAGSQLVKDIRPGTAGSIGDATYSMEYNGVYYFKANDEVHGNELWRSDGTEAGTYMVKDIYPGSSSGLTASNYLNIQNKNYAVINNFLFFVAEDSTGEAIWKTDGTEEGTVKVVTTSSEPVILENIENKFFFAINNKLWSTDGTQAGTQLLGTYNDDSTTSQFRETCIHDGNIYFSVYTGTGLSLFKSDGTVTGTTLVKGGLVTEAVGMGNIQYLQSCGDYVYFVIGTTTGSETGDKLWRTDGTTDGTVLVDNTGSLQGLKEFTCQDNNLFYLHYGHPTTIWVSNGYGPTAPTQIEVIVNNHPDFGVGNIGLSGILGIANDIIYVEGTTLEGGRELYAAGISNILSRNETDPKSTSLSGNITIYPNPAKDKFTLSLRDNSIIRSVEIYDLTGKHVFSKNVDIPQYNVDISELSKGIYIVRIKTDRSTESVKVIHN